MLHSSYSFLGAGFFHTFCWCLQQICSFLSLFLLWSCWSCLWCPSWSFLRHFCIFTMWLCWSLWFVLHNSFCIFLHTQRASSISVLIGFHSFSSIWPHSCSSVVWFLRCWNCKNPCFSCWTLIFLFEFFSLLPLSYYCSLLSMKLFMPRIAFTFPHIFLYFFVRFIHGIVPFPLLSLRTASFSSQLGLSIASTYMISWTIPTFCVTLPLLSFYRH